VVYQPNPDVYDYVISFLVYDYVSSVLGLADISDTGIEKLYESGLSPLEWPFSNVLSIFHHSLWQRHCDLSRMNSPAHDNPDKAQIFPLTFHCRLNETVCGPSSLTFRSVDIFPCLVSLGCIPLSANAFPACMRRASPSMQDIESLVRLGEYSWHSDCYVPLVIVVIEDSRSCPGSTLAIVLT
jgi:hypothetical protein